MTTELNIKITAETAEDAMFELAALSFRAAQELGFVPQPANTATAVDLDLPNTDFMEPEPPAPEIVARKANGGEPPPAKEPKKAKKAAAAPAPAPEPEPKVDREAVLEGLTKIYGGGDPKVRKAITEFRDGRGAERLRDLKDEDIPEAAALLADLKLQAEAAP